MLTKVRKSPDVAIFSHSGRVTDKAEFLPAGLIHLAVVIHIQEHRKGAVWILYPDHCTCYRLLQQQIGAYDHDRSIGRIKKRRIFEVGKERQRSCLSILNFRNRRNYDVRITFDGSV